MKTDAAQTQQYRRLLFIQLASETDYYQVRGGKQCKQEEIAKKTLTSSEK